MNKTMEPTNMAQLVISSVLFSATSILGVVGNPLVLIAVAVSRQLQTTTNIFVVTLAISDFTNSLVMPVQILSLLGVGATSPSFRRLCSVVGFCLYVGLSISVTTLTLIAFNRFYMITRPKQEYQKLYTRRKIAITMTVLYGAITLWITVFVASGLATFGPYQGICGHSSGNAIGYAGGALFIVCIGCIIFCYTKILIHVRAHLRKTAALDSDVKSAASPNDVTPPLPNSRDGDRNLRVARRFAQRQQDVESKITTNMLIVVLLFFVCVTPSTLTLVLPGDQAMANLAFAIISTSCCLNPIVYAWKHPIFRQAFRSILRRRLADIREPTHWVRSIAR